MPEHHDLVPILLGKILAVTEDLDKKGVGGMKGKRKDARCIYSRWGVGG